MGYPSREVLAAWTGRAGARGARGQARPGGGRGQAYGGGALVAGGVTSRQVAAEVGVEASVVRNRVASTAARTGIGGRSSETG